MAVRRLMATFALLGSSILRENRYRPVIAVIVEIAWKKVNAANHQQPHSAPQTTEWKRLEIYQEDIFIFRRMNTPEFCGQTAQSWDFQRHS